MPLIATLIAAVALIPAAPTKGAPAICRQWLVENSNSVCGCTEYQLHNLRRRALNLTSELGAKGGGVDWMGTSGGHFEFRRTNLSDHRTLNPAESVALYNTKAKKFLNSKLELSGSPTYEWQVHDRQNATFALYNTTQRTYLILLEGRSFTRQKAGEALAWYR